MAPGVLAFQWALAPYGRLGWLASFLYLACAALRLARFNCNTATMPKGFFQGLPSPAAAGVMATLVIFQHATAWPADALDAQFAKRHVALVLALTIASLMVSTIRFPSFKELNWKSRTTFGYLMIGVMAMVLIAVKPEVTLFLTLTGYVALSMVWNIFRVFRSPVATNSAAKTHSAE